MTAVKSKARPIKSRQASESFALVSPVYAGIERPLTTAQLAAHLQVSTRTIANYRALRLIPFIRINARNIRYRISAVEAVLNRNNI